MILRPTGWPVYHRASKRLSNAARSCARHDRERNALSCWQTWKTGTLMHPSLWAGHSYKLLWQLLALYPLEVDDPLSAQAIRKEVDRYNRLLRLEGHCALAAISQILKQLGLPFSSIGYISQRLATYARALPKAALSGTQIAFLLCDEIFTLGQPILITVEPRSLAMLKIELVDNREAETWKQHWEALADAGLIEHPTVV